MKLAKKLCSISSHMKESLPKKSYFDFGMRAIKSIAAAAGKAMR